MEIPRGWYEAEVLMADLTAHRHTMRGSCGEKIEARMLLLYPRASTVLVRPEKDAQPHSGEKSWMSHDSYRRALCPLCEGGEMRAVNASLARCSGCQDTMDHGFFDALRWIRSLPEVGSKEAPARSDPHRPGPGSAR